MITNERQYRITCVQLKKLKESIESFDINDNDRKTKSKLLAKAELDALQSEFENLSLQVQEYEALKSGAVETLRASCLEELPSILIKARIVKGLSQRKFAELLSLKEQQIQRYEAEEYASANLSRLAEVANALGLNMSEVAEFRNLQNSLDLNIESLAWNQFPIKEMYLRNWFEGLFAGSLKMAIDNAKEIAKEFIANAMDNPIRALARQRIRHGGRANRYALLAWQCRLIMLSRKINIKNKFKQETITNEWFNRLARLSCQEDGPRKAVDYLQEAGIPLIIVPHLENTYLDGAALLLPKGPVIGITLRYDRLDSFWFVLFHELIHVKKHLHKGKTETIFDDLDVSANEIEKEADECAGEALVPKEKWETALARYVRSKEVIIGFAKEIGVSPAIVAGKIRRETENYYILTDMVGQGKVKRQLDIDFS